jgi:Gas vesicle synthesis protein GvpL/GvpF
MLYLYGIVRAEQGLPRAAGVALGAIRHEGLVALIERVPASVFAPEILETQLTSLEWVTQLARKHESLLHAAMENGPVVPARLCTLFSGAEAVCARLAEDQAAIAGTLDRLGPRKEWGLKVHCDRDRLGPALAAGDAAARELAAAEERATPGQRYVLSRKRAARVAELIAARIEQIEDDLLDACDALDIEARARPLPPEGAGQGEERLVATLAVLAADGDRRALEARIEEIGMEAGEDAFTFEICGPWPPYSFVQEEPADDATGEERC